MSIDVSLDQAPIILARYNRYHKKLRKADPPAVNEMKQRILDAIDNLCFPQALKDKTITRYNIDVGRSRTIVGFYHRHHYHQCLIHNRVFTTQGKMEAIISQFFYDSTHD